MNIVPNYLIHEQTSALLPVMHYDYQTLVIENHKKLYIKQTPFEIIQQSCLSRFTLYEGIRKAVIKKTGYKRKTPIPINPHQNIYFFPTHATNDYECCWISYYHVLRIRKHHHPQKNKASTTILLKNGQTLQIDISDYILKKQMKRTLDCISKYLEVQTTTRSGHNQLLMPGFQ